MNSNDKGSRQDAGGPSGFDSGPSDGGAGGNRDILAYGRQRWVMLKRRYRQYLWLYAVDALLLVLVLGDFANLYLAVETALRTSELLALMIAVSVTALAVLLPFLAGKLCQHRRHRRPRGAGIGSRSTAGSGLAGGSGSGSATATTTAGTTTAGSTTAGSTTAGSGIAAGNNIQANASIIVLLVIVWVGVLVAVTLLRLSVCGIGPFVSLAGVAGDAAGAAGGAGISGSATGGGSAIAAIGASLGSQSLAAELAMIAVLTAMLSGSGLVAFVSAYAKDPLRSRLKSLEQQRLALQERVEFLSAMKREFDLADGYQLSLIEGDQACYAARQRQLEASAEALKHQARLSIAEHLGSPAATSALIYMDEQRTAELEKHTAQLEKRTEELEKHTAKPGEQRTMQSEDKYSTAHRPQIKELTDLRWDNEQASLAVGS